MSPAIFLTGLMTGLTLIVAIGAQNAFVLRQGLRREHVVAVVGRSETVSRWTPKSRQTSPDRP